MKFWDKLFGAQQSTTTLEDDLDSFRMQLKFKAENREYLGLDDVEVELETELETCEEISNDELDIFDNITNKKSQRRRKRVSLDEIILSEEDRQRLFEEHILKIFVRDDKKLLEMETSRVDGARLLWCHLTGKIDGKVFRRMISQNTRTEDRFEKLKLLKNGEVHTNKGRNKKVNLGVNIKTDMFLKCVKFMEGKMTIEELSRYLCS